MIGWLNGRCVVCEADHLVLDVRGVGYRVFLGDHDLAACAPGDEVELWIHTQIREDAFLLYGFRGRSGRELFRSLVAVSGVGPKGAMSLLSVLEPSELATAVQRDDVASLCRAKGIGKRTAELIIVKLRDRLPVELLMGADEGPTASDRGRRAASHGEAVSALVHLGYPRRTAEAAVQVALEEGASDELTTLIRSALATLRQT